MITPRNRPTGNRRAVAKWKKANPHAARAHRIVTRALKAGILERLPCEVCGESKVEGHHDSYEDPLIVRWLCRRHHKAHHKKIRLVQAQFNFGKPKEDRP